MTESLSDRLKLGILRSTYAQREHYRIDELIQEDRVENDIPTPSDIFRLNQHDPMVHIAVSYWLQGDLSWEQALMKCVVLLSEQAQALMKEKLTHWERSPMPPIHVTLHNKGEDSK